MENNTETIKADSDGYNVVLNSYLFGQLRLLGAINCLLRVSLVLNSLLEEAETSLFTQRQLKILLLSRNNRRLFQLRLLTLRYFSDRHDQVPAAP